MWVLKQGNVPSDWCPGKKWLYSLGSPTTKDWIHTVAQLIQHRAWNPRVSGLDAILAKHFFPLLYIPSQSIIHKWQQNVFINMTCVNLSIFLHSLDSIMLDGYKLTNSILIGIYQSQCRNRGFDQQKLPLKNEHEGSETLTKQFWGNVHK